MRLGVAAALVDGRLVDGDLEIAGGRVERVGLAPRGRGTAVPGFVDLQVNGFGGVDVNGAGTEDLLRIAAALPATGVTAWLPTLISAPEAELEAGLGAIARAAGGGGARVLGAHLEGPFLSPERPGAHPPGALAPPDGELARRLLAAGPVALVTLAPELPGALEVVALLRGAGVAVSAGHSAATAEQAHTAFDAGVGAVTHVFNAMGGIGARAPGLAGAALASDVLVCTVLDGAHLAADVAGLVLRAAGDRLVLVTDATAAAGMGDGTFRLGAEDVIVTAGVARRANGTLAGSTGTMDAAVRALSALGASLPEAVAAATRAPARVLGRDDAGVLRPGAHADVTVLDDRLEVVRTLVGGEEAG